MYTRMYIYVSTGLVEFELAFINSSCILITNFYSIKINKTGVNKKTGTDGIYAPLILTILSAIMCYGLADKIYV